MDDSDIEALRLTSSVLDPLSPAVRQRVLRFLNDRYAEKMEDEIDDPQANLKLDDSAIQPSRGLVDLEALYIRAKTTAQWERALITGYWLQELKRKKDFDAMSVNQAMRQCGYGISNITRELTKLTGWKLIAQQPAQNRNERRRFRVSPDGLQWARRHLGQAEG